MSSIDEVIVERVGHVAWVTINRPARLNALARSTFAALVRASIELDLDPAVRVIVFGGAGDRAFSAGVDLKELNEAGSIQDPMREVGRNLNEVVLELTKPTIALVNGVAAGGGCELALACDIRVASDKSRFALPEAKVGMGANFASVVLPQLISRSIALEMLYTGQIISAARALEVGLVNHVVEHAKLRDFVAELASTIAGNAPLTLQRMKAVAYKSAGLPVAAGLRLGVGPNPYVSQDRIEGAKAFVEKRPPRFEGR